MSQTNRIEPVYGKTKTLNIDLIEECKLRVAVSHKDPGHCISLTVIAAIPRLVIETIECKMTQFSHEECLLAESALQEMVGMIVEPGIFKLLKKKEAGKGCTCLNELFREACSAVIQGMDIYGRSQIEKLLSDLDSVERFKIMLMLRPEWIDACVLHNTQSMCKLENDRLPLRGSVHF
jgi:hypothetical protein